jgi:hypothetical protein
MKPTPPTAFLTKKPAAPLPTSHPAALYEHLAELGTFWQDLGLPPPVTLTPSHFQLEQAPLAQRM